MFAWTQHMNFARWVILLSFLGSAVLGYFVYEQKQRLTEVEGQVELAPRLVKNLVAEAHKLESLINVAADRQDLDSIDSYITKTASAKQIEIGSVDIKPGTRAYGTAFEDEIYTIKPPSIVRKPEYQRTKIANFAYMLERGTSVRVTRLRLFPPSHYKFKPHEIGPDVWTFELEVRQRRRKVAES
ncbi:hypothetical protein Pla163_35730 [Planctomycetes bacterium Pla163]|uniref:Uncharacterized protein n=1 Tax=Rohdeia mirabilis TaxID=2528008 RepID=A0A518D4M4_9BACT|nr:hypothetical protein Pla163_35730 [Planctomycetes bacterium Pla163]